MMSTRNFFTAALCTASLTACSPTVPAQAAPHAASPLEETAKVTKVTDGDTVHVITMSGAKLDVRVVGENSPEAVAPGRPVECWGPQASAEAHRVLDGQTITVVIDPTQGGTQHIDKYQRALRYVRLPSGEDLSMHMVAGGWSRAYKVSGPAPQEWPQLVAAQTQAQASHAGLWGPPCNGGR